MRLVRLPDILIFVPMARDVATCMFSTDIDLFMKQVVHVARCNLRDRKLQRALTQFFKPENYFEVRKALEMAGRADLIGNGGGEKIMIQSRTPAVVDDTYYPASDGQPVGETPWHVKNLFYASDPLNVWYAA